ncbi:hypothetical protein CHS0354_029184 [Potamilus streckersoni]|uniref:Uncharacterized protein n=1 Tax=Potamilus streckersoni TaxID=2493646 RepID=A0AAE0TGV9_9BIVA|nr:hypothetical protein CHS0354_029184 [Potamilus streckersoni]
MAALEGMALMDKISFSLVGVFVAVLLVTSDFGTISARSLAEDDGYFPQQMIKRNTWWSKKSFDNALPISQDSAEGPKCKQTISSYNCYVNKCVGNFVACARQSRSEEVFEVCKLLHKSCAASCSLVEDEVFLGL